MAEPTGTDKFSAYVLCWIYWLICIINQFWCLLMIVDTVSIKPRFLKVKSSCLLWLSFAGKRCGKPSKSSKRWPTWTSTTWDNLEQGATRYPPQHPLSCLERASSPLPQVPTFFNHFFIFFICHAIGIFFPATWPSKNRGVPTSFKLPAVVPSFPLPHLQSDLRLVRRGLRLRQEVQIGLHCYHLVESNTGTTKEFETIQSNCLLFE